MYDHMVAAASGRSSIQSSLPKSAVTPKLNEVCNQLLERLGSDDEVWSPQQLASALRTDFTLSVGDAQIAGLL